eukprot:s6159_g4.t1
MVVLQVIVNTRNHVLADEHWQMELALQLGPACIRRMRSNTQRTEVSAFVDQPTRCNMLNYGRANIVLDCEMQGRDSTVVFRFSPLSSNSDRSSWHFGQY